jgi:hypothetical protein
MSLRAVVLVVVLGLLTGCGQVVGGKERGMNPMEELEQRPREAQTEERYVRALSTFQERVAQELDLTWSKDPQREGASGCGEPFSGLGGVSFTVFGGATERFDHADWPAVEAIADAVAKGEGFTKEKVVVVDEPDYKKMAWYDDQGAELEVGADKLLMPAIYGACVLP